MKKEPEIEALLKQNYRLLEEINFEEKWTNKTIKAKEFVRGMIFAYQLILRDEAPNVNFYLKTKEK
jgi:hypothetical protein